MSLIKLRNTWNQYFPAKTLYELDVRTQKTDPNWPVVAPPGMSAHRPIVQPVQPAAPSSAPGSTTVTATTATSLISSSTVATPLSAASVSNVSSTQKIHINPKFLQQQQVCGYLATAGYYS